MAISDINENFPVEGIDQPSQGFRDNFGHIKTALSALDSGKEPTITAGTTAQYYRGDKTFQPLNTTAVAEGTNLYHTVARVLASVLTGLSTATNSAILATDSILVAIGKLQAQVTARAGLALNNIFTVAQRGAVTPLTDGATITPDFNSSNFYQVTLGGNRTLANPTNQVAGQSGCIWIIQDATGSRTLSYGANWKFVGGTAPTLSTTANAVDRLDYIVRATGFVQASLAKDIK